MFMILSQLPVVEKINMGGNPFHSFLAKVFS